MRTAQRPPRALFFLRRRARPRRPRQLPRPSHTWRQSVANRALALLLTHAHTPALTHRTTRSRRSTRACRRSRRTSPRTSGALLFLCALLCAMLCAQCVDLAPPPPLRALPPARRTHARPLTHPPPAACPRARSRSGRCVGLRLFWRGRARGGRKPLALLQSSAALVALTDRPPHTPTLYHNTSGDRRLDDRRRRRQHADARVRRVQGAEQQARGRDGRLPGLYQRVCFCACVRAARARACGPLRALRDLFVHTHTAGRRSLF